MKYNNHYIEAFFDNIKKLQALGYKVDYAHLLSNNYIHIIDGECYGRNMIPNSNKIVDEELEKDYSEKLKLDKIVYSTNQENYTNDIDWILCQLEEDSEINTIYVAERVDVLHKDIFNVNRLIENLEDDAYDLCDDWSFNYLSEFKDTNKKQEFQDLILNWMNNNLSQPNWFTVKKEKEISKEEFLESLVKI